jgi:hypothetical protein
MTADAELLPKYPEQVRGTAAIDQWRYLLGRDG